MIPRMLVTRKLYPNIAGIATQSAVTVVISAPETPGAIETRFGEPASATPVNASITPQTVPRSRERANHSPQLRAKSSAIRVKALFRPLLVPSPRLPRPFVLAKFCQQPRVARERCRPPPESRANEMSFPHSRHDTH